MYIHKSSFLIVITLLVCLSSNQISALENTEQYNIPYLEDAKVFAEFTNELPAVVNYFTAHNEQEIVNFYQEKFGKAISSEMKRGRLTLSFNHEDKKISVIVSQQGKKHQVDILLK